MLSQTFNFHQLFDLNKELEAELLRWLADTMTDISRYRSDMMALMAGETFSPSECQTPMQMTVGSLQYSSLMK